MRTQAIFVKPRLSHTDKVIDDKQPDIIKTTVTHTFDQLRDRTLTIPIGVMLNFDSIFYLAKNANPNVLRVTMLLLGQITSKAQENKISISQSEIALFLSLTRATVNSIFQYLIEKKFITKIGKTEYLISANLAWFGNQVDWAREIRRLEIEDFEQNKESYEQAQEECLK